MSEILNAMIWIVGLIVLAPAIIVIVAGLFGASLLALTAGIVGMAEWLSKKGWL